LVVELRFNLQENGFYFRGQRIWDAVIRHLLSIGMASADQVLLTGCSAGGLAVVLHCDEFQAFFPHTDAGGRGTTVKCLADAGLFLDAYVSFNLTPPLSFFLDCIKHWIIRCPPLDLAVLMSPAAAA